MKKAICTLAMLLTMSAVADAKPNWKRIGKIALVWGAPVASSLLATKGGVDCRKRNGVAPCSEHYGEFNAFEGVRGGFSLTMSTLSWKCLNGTGDKMCYSMAVGTAVFNTYWWRHEEGIYKPEDTTKIGTLVVPKSFLLKRY
jgi:hypothetical protein